MEKYTNADYKNISELVVMIANFYNYCASNIDEEERIFDNILFVQSRLKLMDKIAILYNRIIDIMYEKK